MCPAGDVGPHCSGDCDHDSHVEGLQFKAEGSGPDVDGALSGGVDGAEDVRDEGGCAGDVDDKTTGFNEERRKG